MEREGVIDRERDRGRGTRREWDGDDRFKSLKSGTLRSLGLALTPHTRISTGYITGHRLAREAS